MAKKCAVAIIDRMIGGDEEMRDLVGQAKINANIDQMVYDARTQAELSQQALVELVGSSRQPISRVEDAGYESSFLAILR